MCRYLYSESTKRFLWRWSLFFFFKQTVLLQLKAIGRREQLAVWLCVHVFYTRGSGVCLSADVSAVGGASVEDVHYLNHCSLRSVRLLYYCMGFFCYLTMNYSALARVCRVLLLLPLFQDVLRCHRQVSHFTWTGCRKQQCVFVTPLLLPELTVG